MALRVLRKCEQKQKLVTSRLIYFRKEHNGHWDLISCHVLYLRGDNEMLIFGENFQSTLFRGVK